MVGGSWRAGTMFGQYRLDRLIGRGGMGEVYEAYDTVKDRSVALKVLTEQLADDPRFRQRFEREAHAAARLKEAHVIPIHDYGEIEGRLFLDMRLVEGRTLRDLIEDVGPLSPARAVAIIEQVAAALDAAHRDDLVHRDIKPDNILITGDNFVYLVDFGIANTMTSDRLTTIGAALGSFSYMAPERFADSQTTPAADIYSLACVLHECLTGAKPFNAHTAPQLMHAHLYAPPPAPSALRPGLPPGLDAVVIRGMAKNPGERFPTAGMLAAAAKVALVPPQPISAVTTVLPEPPARPLPTTFMHTGPTPPPQFTPAPFLPAPPAPPRRRPGRALLIAGIVAIVAALVVGVGIWRVFHKSGGTGVDVASLDVGKYPTTPRKLTGSATKDEGRALAAMALAEGLPDPYQIDNTLDHRYASVLPTPAMAATAIAGTNTPITQPVMEKYGMVSAYQVFGIPELDQDWSSNPTGNALYMVIMSYPNPDAAARAATEMEAADFAVAPANIRIAIPKYAQAHAHYQPAYSSIGATWASGSFVTSVIAALDRPDVTPDALAQRVGQVLAAEEPLLDKVNVYTEAALTLLPRDPDQMLSRVFAVDDQQPISANYENLGPRAASLCESSRSHRDKLFEQAGIDRCAVSPEANVLRTRDDDAARTLLTAARTAVEAEFVKRDIKSPAGLASARCYETKDGIWSNDANSRFECGVVFGRYVAYVESNDEQDVRHRAAAQYAILANS